MLKHAFISLFRLARLSSRHFHQIALSSHCPYPRCSLLCVMLLALTACSKLGVPISDSLVCKNHSYIGNKLSAMVSSRGSSGSPVRIAVFPFDVPESFTPKSPWHQDFGVRIGQYVARELLTSEEFSMVEYQDQATWLGKRDEFFSGNYLGINVGRQSGYDLILVGYVDQLEGTHELAIYGKVIDVAHATTLWFGKTEVQARSGILDKATNGAKSIAGIPYDREVFADMNSLAGYGASCLSEQIVK